MSAFDAHVFKCCRARLGITQTEFAILFGVHTITVSKWERNKAEPSTWHFLLANSVMPNGFNVSRLLATRGPILTLAQLLKHHASH